MKSLTEQLLDSFLGKYTEEIELRARRLRQKMRKRLPGALELIYDNYNALAIGYGPTEKASQAIFSLVLYPRWVSLFFLQAKGLDDPHGLLRGKGTVARHIVLEDGSALDKPEVQALMEAQLRLAKVPIDPKQKHRVVIKMESAKQRPRRPA
jgi:hypothetical protein